MIEIWLRIPKGQTTIYKALHRKLKITLKTGGEMAKI
jgi:hypothetical protein